MINNLPKKYEQNFFSKIKSIFLSLFKKNKNVENIKTENIQSDIKPMEDKIETKPNKVQDPIVQFREESRRRKIRDEIIELVLKNPNSIDNLPLERLEELYKFCLEVVEEGNEEIERLERALAK